MKLISNVSNDKKKPVPRKKKHISKKRKIAWRKHISTKDVDDFLEDKRLEERLGVPFKDRPDEDLFQVHTDPSINTEDLKPPLSKKEHIRLKPIKCFEILQSRSAVPDPIVKRNRVRTPEERKHPIAKKKEAERISKGILKLKEIDAIRNRTIAAERKAQKPKRGEFSSDLWDDTGNVETNPLGVDGEWLAPETLRHTVKNTRKFRKKIPKQLLKKPYAMPAVELPHPGISYNPSFKDHQKLLQEVAENEIKLIKEEKHLNRVTTQMFSRTTFDESEKSWLKEMSGGLPETDQTTEEHIETTEEGADYKAINPPVKNLKKTKSKRRKLKEARMEELKRKEASVEKRKIADIYKLRFMEKELESKERKMEKLREKRQKIKAIKAKQPKQLSRIKFEPGAVEFNLGEELSGNLRAVKPEGNLLNDRFKSLQRRNIVEPTLKQLPPKKGKRKKYVKNTHRV